VRGLIYDAVIRPLTTQWYREVLVRLAPHHKLLDVGIGTGGALVNNAAIIRQKDLHVTGVDIDPDYVERCRKLLQRTHLDEQVDVKLQSIYDHRVSEPYDAIYFSASFMLLPDPAACLEHVRSLLAANGRVFFTQTFQDKPSKLMEKAKPMLHKVTTIHFGQVTYEAEFLRIVEQGGLRLDELATIGKQGARTFRLAVGRFGQSPALA
jgi:tRNA A58 N-methylase Trm61